MTGSGQVREEITIHTQGKGFTTFQGTLLTAVMISELISTGSVFSAHNHNEVVA